MKIAIDYDETYTAAPILFKLFALAAIQYGHNIKFVTYRPKIGCNEDIEADAEDLGIDIIYTAGKQKQHVYEADVWIDDSPETIVSFENLVNYHDACVASNDFK